MHRCNQCGKDETEVAFGWRNVNGKRYPKHICNPCRRSYDKKFKVNVELLRKKEERHHVREKHERANGIDRDKWILQDTRSWDKKRGFKNDLTRDFIALLITRPCVYCGDTSLRMTLDRKDNGEGHIQENVVGSCIRCNFLRRDMPYDAWLALAPTVRQAREMGLFGAWTGEIHRPSRHHP